MRQCSFAIAWLTAVSLALSPLSAAGFGQAPSDSNGMLANNCSEESAPLPERPVLGRSTFAAHAPRLPAKHKPRKSIAKKKTDSFKHKAAKPPVAKTVKPTVHKPHKPVKKLPKKPSKPRKTIHKRNGGAGHDGGNKHAGKDTLQRATFGSPICQDRAPVMQAFGMGDKDLPLGDEFAKAVQDALSPQDNQFTDTPGGGTQNNGRSFPNTPGISVNTPPNNGGGGGGGGGNGGNGGNGGTNPPPPAVPEPASWVLMILGFGAIGLSIRRRRRRAAQKA